MLTIKLKTKIRPSRSLIKATTLLLATISVSLLNVSAWAAGNAENGKGLSQTCLGCHGAPGLRNPSPVYTIPMIGGQTEDYIVAALKAYKDKTRAHKTMQAQSASLSEQDMQDIGAYFASLDGKPGTQPISKSKIEAGKKIAGTCAGCHGTDGATPLQADYPKLAGQYEDYLIHALKQYRSGDRTNLLMNGLVQNMGIKDIEALAAWFASQQADGVIAPKTDIFKF